MLSGSVGRERVREKRARRKRGGRKNFVDADFAPTQFHSLFSSSSFLRLLPSKCARSSTSLCSRARARLSGARTKGSARRKPPRGVLLPLLLLLTLLLRHGQSETIPRFLSSPSPSRRASPWASSSAPATRWSGEGPACSRHWQASSRRGWRAR